MQLKYIEKTRYRQHLNMASVIATVMAIALALIYGQILIHYFANGSGSNFKLNLTGVVLAVISLVALFNKLKDCPYLREVRYVWALKQTTNKIFRKLHKIEAAAWQADRDAMTILSFYYDACEQLYRLDDNTLTLDNLSAERSKLQTVIAMQSVIISADDYQFELLAKF